MMTEKLRFTGDWPPASLLTQYPNWEYALDEEDVEGQDETTIRPESEQKMITENTAYTAARAKQADGTERMAIAAIVGGRIDAVDVFINDRDAWRIGRNGDKWEPFIQTWLPENERMPHVLLSDTSIFPLRVATLVPTDDSGHPLTVEIG
jgi:hypothetical protein